MGRWRVPSLSETVSGFEPLPHGVVGTGLVGVCSRGVSQLAGGEPPEAAGQLLLGLALPRLWGQAGVCLDTSCPAVAVEGGPILRTSWGSLPLDAVRAVKGGTCGKTGPSRSPRHSGQLGLLSFVSLVPFCSPPFCTLFFFIILWIER